MSEIDTSRESVEEIAGDLDAVGRPGIARMMRALLTRAEAAEAAVGVLGAALNEAWEVETQDGAALTPFGKAMLDRWATALRDTAEASAARDARLTEPLLAQIGALHGLILELDGPVNAPIPLDLLRRLAIAAHSPSEAAAARDARIRDEGRREGIEEALMRVPGGDVCSPQAVADDIRALLDAPAGAKGGADE